MKTTWTPYQTVSHGILEADISNNGGDGWKVEIRHIENGALHRRRYFNFQRDGAGIYRKALAWAHEQIVITPMTFAIGKQRRGGFR